ncbi:AAA family ATPase [Polyangium sp. 15x6]|uniref:AAA family ATPase n=1 Tax=Polyangium sp. 15x6 TaxID=3042687 RepID=UPI00249A3CDE|nr:AAA family ATPase [Polyangium sp. 15x6]MDI3284729.1 AAA family ATPase [Polyangium sp. 15x6]
MREGGQYYVDKTAFLGDVLRAPPQVLLFPRPRRFGKSLNLSMLKYFPGPYRAAGHDEPPRNGVKYPGDGRLRAGRGDRAARVVRKLAQEALQEDGESLRVSRLPPMPASIHDRAPKDIEAHDHVFLMGLLVTLEE